MEEPGTGWLMCLKGWLRIQPSFENTAIIIFFLSVKFKVIKLISF